MEYHVASAGSSPFTFLDGVEVVILDPPRKGLEPELLHALCLQNSPSSSSSSSSSSTSLPFAPTSSAPSPPGGLPGSAAADGSVRPSGSYSLPPGFRSVSPDFGLLRPCDRRRFLGIFSPGREIPASPSSSVPDVLQQTPPSGPSSSTSADSPSQASSSPGTSLDSGEMHPRGSDAAAEYGSDEGSGTEKLSRDGRPSTLVQGEAGASSTSANRCGASEVEEDLGLEAWGAQQVNASGSPQLKVRGGQGLVGGKADSSLVEFPSGSRSSAVQIRQGASQHDVHVLPDLHTIVYLSCGYEALERDTRALVASGAWKVDFAKAFWFFPFTNSLETLVVFRRVVSAVQ
eukprot:jgi/Botrbrau1/15501/Bobra.43_2s0118.1